MDLKNKRIAFLGDSITEGVGVADIPHNRYDHVLKALLELDRTFNYGISGSRIAHQHKATADCPRFDLCFCGRAYNIDRSADVIVVFGGTNDYGHGDAAFGNYGDATPDTFCGGVRFLLTLLKNNFPNSVPFIMAPCRRMADERPAIHPNKLPDARPLYDYCEVIMKTADELGLPAVNLYRELPIDPNIEESRVQYAPDGLHLNDAGHRILAELIAKKLKAL